MRSAGTGIGVLLVTQTLTLDDRHPALVEGLKSGLSKRSRVVAQPTNSSRADRAAIDASRGVWQSSLVQSAKKHVAQSAVAVLN